MLDSVSQSPRIDWPQVGRVIPLPAVDLDRHEITRLDELLEPGSLENGQHLRHQTRLGRLAAGIHVIDFRSRHDVLLLRSLRAFHLGLFRLPARSYELSSSREVESLSSVCAIIAYCALENKGWLLSMFDAPAHTC